MSVWRRRALERLPEAGEDDDATRSPFGLVFCLLPAVRDAHREDDGAFLRRAYDFAQWAHHQRSGSTLGNTVDVGFYEHLFDDWSLREQVAPWLSAAVRRDVWPLWAARLDPDRLAALRRLLDATQPRRNEEPPA